MLQSTMRTVIVDKHPKIEYLRKSLSVIWSRSEDFSIKADIANSIKLMSKPLGPVPNILSYVVILLFPAFRPEPCRKGTNEQGISFPAN